MYNKWWEGAGEYWWWEEVVKEEGCIGFVCFRLTATSACNFGIPPTHTYKHTLSHTQHVWFPGIQSIGLWFTSIEKNTYRTVNACHY